MSGRPTVLEALQAAIARPLAPLDDSGLTGTARSSLDALGVSAVVLADDLTGHLVPGIVTRVGRGGPLAAARWSRRRPVEPASPACRASGCGASSVGWATRSGKRGPGWAWAGTDRRE